VCVVSPSLLTTSGALSSFSLLTYKPFLLLLSGKSFLS
jgi:hypothetical protein